MKEMMKGNIFYRLKILNFLDLWMESIFSCERNGQINDAKDKKSNGFFQVAKLNKKTPANKFDKLKIDNSK